MSFDVWKNLSGRRRERFPSIRAVQSEELSSAAGGLSRMNPSEKRLSLHEDPALFKEALEFTSAMTGFTLRLAEKDYFCSIALSHLAHKAHDLVFKGGTCLA